MNENELCREFADYLAFSIESLAADELESPVEFEGIFFEESAAEELIEDFLLTLGESCANVENKQLLKSYVRKQENY